ncbi:MAG: protein kinase [Blastocatellia bacterium]|nr:protein kinase [Blastocatellia bacterium]
MQPGRWQQIQDVYLDALNVSAERRAAFLAQTCAGDEDLRHEVESLLNAHEEVGTFLQVPAVKVAEEERLRHADAAPTLVSPLGQRIHQYQILARLGAGGMGEVWLAEDTHLHRNVALKVLPAHHTNDRERVRRFEQEARAASALNHPNIITIHDLGESDSGCFIVMEHVAGRTLRVLAAEPMALSALLDWSGQIAKALSAAHAANIIHRDIKPDNIMVRNDGYVKVLDFGLARLNTAHDEMSSAMTMPGTVMGTVKYMSPEQTRGEVVTAASDIFAFGIVLYELATGQHPFNGATMFAVMQAITTSTPVAPSQLKPELPAELNALLLQMLAKDAAVRPSAIAVAAKLEEIARGSDSATKPATSHQPPTTNRHTVGRERERAELQAAFLSGRSSLLCIAGEPGIGKTTLVEDWLTELATQHSCTIARGRCSERLAGTEAYLPLLEALESLLRHSTTSGSESGSSWAATMKQLAPTWYAQVVPLNSESEESARLLAEVKAASQERMKRELAAFLTAVATPQPLVIFFDDLHWADVSTIDLLSFLAGKFDVMRVLIVVTYRPSDMLLAKHPFLQIRPDLQARGLCRELLLEFLTAAEIAEYLTLEFPRHAFPPDFAKLIHAKTEGSPLFMADLVRYLRDRGVIAEETGTRGACVPRLAQALPDIERELPESVRGMIERKIGQLSEEDRKLLTCASVQGYEFDSAVVAQVLKLEADEVEERLETLERVFAFVKLTSEAEFPNGELTLKYRFIHVLYQNALYASLRATRKATLSRDVALALEACYGVRSASVANELALLWEAARDYARASDSFLQAARNAAQINAHREAAQLAERGLGALLKLPETPERDGRELDLQLTLGFSLQSVLSWAAPKAGVAFNRARQLCQQMGDDPRLVAALSGVTIYHLMRAEFVIVKGLCEQMMQLAEQAQDPVLLVMASMHWAAVHFYQGELVSAHQHGERALALDRREYHEAYFSFFNEDLGIMARRTHSYSLWALGYPDRALALAQESITLAEQTSHPFSLGGAHFTTGTVLYNLRDWQPSQQEFEKVIALAEEYALGDFLNYAITWNALTLAYQEPTAAALEGAKQAIASLRATGVTLAMTSVLASLGEVFWLAGRYTEGLETIAEALTLVERTGDRVYEAEFWRIKGELLLRAVASNARAEAESCYRKAIEIARQQSAKSWELRAATSLARLWQRQGKREEARQMLAEIYGWFTEGFDMADLQDAKALLDELSSEFSLQVAAVPSADTLKRELSTPTPSIAVLPFVNISNDPDNEYFCDGLAEELLNALSKIEALHVAARTSSFSFKGKETDIREIGQKLNVGAVLEGSVRKSGQRLRITAQLINIADGYHLWSERYDRQMQDIFDIQDEISLAIVDALKVKLLGAEKAAVTKRYTDNLEAYQLYLKGRFHYGKWTEEGLKKSIEFFNQAISQEPNFAPAYAGVVNAYVFLWFYGFTPPDESIPLIKSAAAKAVAIDGDLAESQFALTRMKFLYEWDWSGAARGFRRTLALNPNYAEAHEQYAIFLAVMGRADEAIAMGRRALELDPLFLNTSISVGFSCWILGQYESLREHGEKLIEFAPDFFGGYWQIGIECWGTGKYEEAIVALQTSVACGANPMVSAYLGYLYGLTGKQTEAQKILDQLQELSTQRHALPFELGMVNVGLGELDRAFALFEQAYEQRAGILIYLKYISAMMPGFKDEPRLADLLRRIGLPA